ncbi:MAG: hypothetical protein AAGH15_24230 [Myxococcota bacterium]
MAEPEPDAELLEVHGDLAAALADPQRFARRLRRESRRGALASIAAGVLVLALLSLAQQNEASLSSYFRGETDLRGRRVFVPAAPPGDVGGLDRAHTELFPQWMIVRSRRSLPASERRRLAGQVFGELRYAVGEDANLVALLDELRDRLRQLHTRRDARRQGPRIDYLVWAWNDYLDQRGVPWRLEASLHVPEPGRNGRERPPALITRSYEVLADLRDPAGRRIRLVRRGDRTNVDEGLLGHATGDRDEGAVVMLDEVLEHGVHHVWPMLHAGLDGRHAETVRSLGPRVRAEAAAQLAPGVLDRLRETAVDQQMLIEVAASIHARASCGNRFRVWGLPWNGLAPPDRLALVDALDRSARDPSCPEVTLGEAARMIGASERLGRTPALEDAVETLTAWLSRAVAAHELRHVADGEGRSCARCPPGLPPAAVDELSAYLAAFGTEGVAYASLLQACTLEPAFEGDADAEGHIRQAPHAQALAVALDALLPAGCRGPIPDDLVPRARALEARWFGASTGGVALPEGMPDRVALLAED